MLLRYLICLTFGIIRLFLCLYAFYQFDHLLKAIKVATDLEADAPHLSGLSVITLEGLGLRFLKCPWFHTQLFPSIFAIINYLLYLSHFRFILITNLFLLKKWIPHVGLPARSAEMC